MASSNEEGQRKKIRNSTDEITVPVVHTPEDLIGKRVKHLCVNETGGDGDEPRASWYEGCVLALCGRARNPFFEIRYDGYDGTYRFQLMEHLKLGILELIPLSKTDLIGASICHRLSVGDSEDSLRKGIGYFTWRQSRKSRIQCRVRGKELL